MGFNHVTMNPIPGYPPDENIQINSFGSGALAGVGQTAIPAVPGKRITIHAIYWTQSGGSGTGIGFLDLATNGNTIFAGLKSYNPANDGKVLPFSQYPWFTCAVGDAFGMVCLTGQTVGLLGQVTYVQG